jgi:hypothetical protein
MTNPVNNLQNTLNQGRAVTRANKAEKAEFLKTLTVDKSSNRKALAVRKVGGAAAKVGMTPRIRPV